MYSYINISIDLIYVIGFVVNDVLSSMFIHQMDCLVFGIKFVLLNLYIHLYV